MGIKILTNLLRSLIAPSLASFSAVSNALTRSIVARSRFSNLGSSHRRSALSRTSCLCTLVSWSRLFSKKEIFCFWANEPPSSSLSSGLAAFLIRACNRNKQNFVNYTIAFILWKGERCKKLTCKSWTNSFLRLWRVCSSLATVSSSPLRSLRACSRLSLVALKKTVIFQHQATPHHAHTDSVWLGFILFSYLYLICTVYCYCALNLHAFTPKIYHICFAYRDIELSKNIHRYYSAENDNVFTNDHILQSYIQEHWNILLKNMQYFFFWYIHTYIINNLLLIVLT